MSWQLSRCDYVVQFGGASHVGNVRNNNEDAWVIDPKLGLFVVADGMGGHAAGEVAAGIAVDTVASSIQNRLAFEAFDAFLLAPTLEARAQVFAAVGDAVKQAHQAVCEEADRHHRFRRMGCTLDVALVLGRQLFVVHVGDGRVFLARPTTFIQLTNDHTLKSSLIQGGVATPSQPPDAREALLNAVGRPGRLASDEIYTELNQGDRILLCSDGIYGEIGDEAELSRLVWRGAPDEACVTLINAALGRGGRDNATAVVVEMGAQRVQRTSSDGGLAQRDRAFALHSPLLTGISYELALKALKSAVEVQFESGESLARFGASDRVAYILLEGSVRTPEGWTLGPGAVLYPESLGGGGKGPALCEAQQRVRTLRIRSDDFREVCAADAHLAAALYERLARYLARMLA